MSSRVDLSFRPSALAGLIAATPWLALLAASLPLASLVHPVALLALPAAGYGAWQRWRQCGTLEAPCAVVRLSLDTAARSAHNQWTIESRAGDRVPVTVAGHSRLSGPLALLALKPAGRHPYRLVVVHGPCPLPGGGTLSGNCEPEGFRRLRARLRLSSQPEKPRRSWRLRKQPETGSPTP